MGRLSMPFLSQPPKYTLEYSYEVAGGGEAKLWANIAAERQLG